LGNFEKSHPLNTEIPFSLIETFAPGLSSSFEDVVIVVPSMVNEGRKASTDMMSADVGTLKREPTGTT
jgi:hypothetical protein